MSKQLRELPKEYIERSKIYWEEDVHEYTKLEAAFVWKNTYEGFDFWYDVNTHNPFKSKLPELPSFDISVYTPSFYVSCVIEEEKIRNEQGGIYTKKWEGFALLHVGKKGSYFVTNVNPSFHTGIKRFWPPLIKKLNIIKRTP